MPTIQVNLGPRSYDIVVTSNDLAKLASYARQRSAGKVAVIVGDANTKGHAHRVAQVLESADFRAESLILEPGESQKSLAVASALYDRLADLNVDRKTLIVAVGGGVIGDLAGFVAATFNRGLPLLMVPTTLLAMVDSSVGGKVGVNHPMGKNLLGAFHQPVGVWIDTAFFDSLPDREFRSGLAEVVKYGVSLDAELFQYLEDHADAILRRDPESLRHIITQSCQIKARIVEQDEREETGLRAILNYGHTFAHAFETVGGYGQWLHGEAVAAGMVCAARLAQKRGLIPADVANRQAHLLSRFKLPTAPKAWPVDELLAVMHRDKKALAGQMRFVLPQRLGSATLMDDVPEIHVRQILEEVLHEKP
jgi:3-dehydroquinate synthase